MINKLMISFRFMGRMVEYDTFLSDVAARVASIVQSDKNAPEFVSQRTAWKMFGRRNVERWKRENKVVYRKSTGRVEYRTADLRLLQRVGEAKMSDFTFDVSEM